MFKKSAIACVLVFLLWMLLDFVIHGVILKDHYELTAHLWRPMPEMMMGIMFLVTLVTAVVFISMYALFVSEKSLRAGVTFGVLFGLALGVGMGFGTYSVMPIPYSMALTWFVGTVVEGAAAGAVMGLIVKG